MNEFQNDILMTQSDAEQSEEESLSENMESLDGQALDDQDLEDAAGGMITYRTPSML